MMTCLSPPRVNAALEWASRRILGFSVILTLFFGLVCPVFGEEEHHDVVNLDQIVVTGTKTQHTLKDVPVETIVVTEQDIKALNAENVMDILGTIPGIQTANHDDVFGTYTWNASMNGLPFDSGYALVLIDGQRVMGCGASGGMGEYGIGLNQVPVSMIERIEVVKGPGSALYGSDAMAGVINIITRKIPNHPTGTAGMSYGRYSVQRENADGSEEDAPNSRVMNQSYVSYGDRLSDSAGYLLYYSYEGAEDIKDVPLSSQRHSFMGKVDSQVGDQVDLSLKYEAGQYVKLDSRDEDTWGLSAKADVQLNPDHGLSLSAYTYIWDFTHGAPGSSSGYKVGDVGYNHGELQYTWNIQETNIFSAGAELLEQGINYTILNSDNSLVVVDETVDVYSAYLQDELKVGQDLTLVAGARFDDHSTFGNEVNPKFSLMYKPLDTTTFRASAGKSFKSPTIRQLYYSIPYQHGTWYNQSNPDLEAEKALGYSAGLEHWMMSNQVMLSLGYSRNDIDDMVVSEDTGTLYNGLPLMIYRNVNKAYTQSIEFMCRAHLSRFSHLTLSYTYMDTKIEESGNRLPYVPEHALSLVPSLRLFEDQLGLSATVSYAGKQYTGTDNVAQIDASTTLDTKMDLVLSPKASLSLEADNVLDSAQGRIGSWQVGRSYMAKLDLTF
ncbi:MAG: TonB-dependent receptor [Proteobacteria bacterium]|nr:TonB-dependent receptor [Pseudomonadota bacterium]